MIDRRHIGHALPALEEFYRSFGEAHLELLPQQ